MVYFIGLMAENIEEIEKMENKMAKVFILTKIKLIKFEFGFLFYLLLLINFKNNGKREKWIDEN